MENVPEVVESEPVNPGLLSYFLYFKLNDMWQLFCCKAVSESRLWPGKDLGEIIAGLVTEQKVQGRRD